MPHLPMPAAVDAVAIALWLALFGLLFLWMYLIYEDAADSEARRWHPWQWVRGWWRARHS